MDILMIIDAITFFSLQNVLDYEGDVEADMCMTFQVERLACFFLLCSHYINYILLGFS